MDVVVLELADLAEGLLDSLKVETSGSRVAARFTAAPTSVTQIANSLAPTVVAARSAARRTQDMNSIQADHAWAAQLSNRPMVIFPRRPCLVPMARHRSQLA